MDIKTDSTGSGIRVTLDDKEMWQEFFLCGTEMIINRSGRRMFPAIGVSVGGLKMDNIYNISLELVPASNHRYKFLNNMWMAVGKAENEKMNQPYVHPQSPSPGTYWEETKISFSRLKITNNVDNQNGKMLLHSMHKYVARVVIETISKSGVCIETFTLPLTSFIAVTAYQNDKITQMKIKNNPFAKAFRDSDVVSDLHCSSYGLGHSIHGYENTSYKLATFNENRSAPAVHRSKRSHILCEILDNNTKVGHPSLPRSTSRHLTDMQQLHLVNRHYSKMSVLPYISPYMIYGGFPVPSSQSGIVFRPLPIPHSECSSDGASPSLPSHWAMPVSPSINFDAMCNDALDLSKSSKIR